jgi:hypothetical protein
MARHGWTFSRVRDAERAEVRLQLLRRGRGNGFRETIRAGHSASGDVLSCVLEDPRWDRQVEERDQYYARLLVQLGADIGPVGERVLREENDEDESDFWLPIGVLAEMARRTHPAAKEALVAAIQRGRKWRACLDALEAAGGEALIGAVVSARDVEALIGGVAVDDLVDAVQAVAAPWEAWAAEVPALRFISDARTRHDAGPKRMSGPVQWSASRIREPAPPALSPNMTTAELLELATAPGASLHVEAILETRSDQATVSGLRNAAAAGTPEQQMVALRILGSRGCTDFMDDAEQFLRSESRLSRDERTGHRTRQAYLRYLERLPAITTLECARQWFTEPWPLSLAAEHILSQHATRDDRVMLEEAGSAALTSKDMYRLCSVVDALAAVGAVESLPFLSEVYSEAPYSYARRRVVKALVPHAAHDVARDLIVEALWDCETESREFACGAVSSGDIGTASRLAEIADDEFEAPDVRKAARGARATRQ